MKPKLVLIVTALFLYGLRSPAQQIIITSISLNGDLTWTSPLTNSLHTVEWASGLGGTNVTWTALTSLIVTNPVTTVKVPTFYRVTAITNADPIVGIWNWFTGDHIQFLADGTLTKTNTQGQATWIKPHAQQNPEQYIVIWRNTYVDNLTLSSTTNGVKLQGYNQFGALVTATKITP